MTIHKEQYVICFHLDNWGFFKADQTLLIFLKVPIKHIEKLDVGEQARFQQFILKPLHYNISGRMLRESRLVR